jgi:hypothetical protein
MSSTYLRAVIRFIFGTLQIAGATVALVFLVETGPSKFTIGCVTITGAITLVSRLLFRKERALEGLNRRRSRG